MAERIRLDRYLSEAGCGTRTQVKKLIRSGSVRIRSAEDGGDIVSLKADFKVDPEKDEVFLDGKLVRQIIPGTLMLHKPSGVISATEDARDETVLDLIREPYAKRLFPVGRLDRDTEGLLLLTCDGQLSHSLLSPGKHVAKTYYAVVSGAPDPDLIRHFREGIDIGEKKPTRSAGLCFLAEDGRKIRFAGTGPEDTPALQEAWGIKRCEDSAEADPPAFYGIESITQGDLARCGAGECRAVISVTEGKFHQIKRMFEAGGRQVRYLKRIAMGCLALDPSLAPGAYRPLTETELEALRGTEIP